MMLVWKLLRCHISVSQLFGFFLANLLGMFIVLLSLQLYVDLRPLLQENGGAIKSDYVILSKQMGGIGKDQTDTFSESEIKEIEEQRFVASVGRFRASQYQVDCSLAMTEGKNFGTQMYFESVPDEFVDADKQKWTFDESNPLIPIILPRNYLSIYNFGFAQSRSLPQISEGMVSMLDVKVRLRGNGRDEMMNGFVAGFSSRINTILVPESFMEWSNQRYATEQSLEPTRLILRMSNPADDAIPQFVQEHSYDIDEDKLDAGKMMFFLKLISAVVMVIGLLISLLSVFILLLSIYLLVQKNTMKLQNLMLIGYSPLRVAKPYIMLTVFVNLGVLLMAVVLMLLCRDAYMQYLWQMFPTLQDAVAWPAMLLGILLFVLVAVLNVFVINRRVMNIWSHKL